MKNWRKLLNLAMRASRLDTSLYEEMETDDSAIGFAIMITLLTGLATGVGTGLITVMGGQGILWFIWGLMSGFFATLAGLFAWVAITYFIGTTFLRGPGRANFSEVAQTIGFANSPTALRLLIFIPAVGLVILVLTGIWSFAASIIAVRQSLDFTTAKAAATSLLGWLIYMAVLVLIYLWVPSPFKMLP
jgi:hypothetical protein